MIFLKTDPVTGNTLEFVDLTTNSHVKSIPLTDQGGGFSHARFSPDGKTVLFSGANFGRKAVSINYELLKAR